MKSFYYVLALVFCFAFLFVFSHSVWIFPGDPYTDKLIVKWGFSLLFASFTCASLIMARIEQVKELIEEMGKKE